VVLGDLASLVSVTLRLLRDDGAVVYINGSEVARDVMPDGPFDYLTLSDGIVGGAAEDTFYPFGVSPSVLVPGTNVVAVEIHQQSRSGSSDISFDAELSGIWAGAGASADGDADGMYDAYEIDQFGSTEAGVPSMDSDGDGVPNLDEFVAGTQATNGASFFRVDRIDPGGIAWTPVSGRVYAVDWCVDPGQAFQEITNGLHGGSFTDPRHAAHPAGCYRIRVNLD
jgi:hypothetical protein